MKKILQSLCFLFLAGLIIAGCEKAADLELYGSGKAPELSASSLTVAAAAADSLNNVFTLSWTDPRHASDSNTYKYVIQFDSSGRNFAKAASVTVIGTRSKTFTGKELNGILLGFGFAFNTPYDVDARVISSYNNNNEQLISNVVKLKMTPYKIPPAVPLPTTSKLYIVGDATVFGWTNPAVMPANRQLTRMDETTWAGIYNLTGSGAYLLLPLAGDWGNKYSVANGSLAGLANGGSFGFNLSDNFPGNVSAGAGFYKMVYNFQRGSFTVTKTNNPLGDELYITGDATTGGWVNNPPAPQKFTAISNGVFEITMAFTPGKYYKFLNTSGQWQPQFGGNSATGGDLFANYGSGSDPDAVPTPAVAGNYKITVNFLNDGLNNRVGTYTVVKL
ncbi:MAG: SusE domain-containing protein [Ferruginibacter sp.]